MGSVLSLRFKDFRELHLVLLSPFQPVASALSATGEVSWGLLPPILGGDTPHFCSSPITGEAHGLSLTSRAVRNVEKPLQESWDCRLSLQHPLPPPPPSLDQRSGSVFTVRRSCHDPQQLPFWTLPWIWLPSAAPG